MIFGPFFKSPLGEGPWTCPSDFFDEDFPFNFFNGEIFKIFLTTVPFLFLRDGGIIFLSHTAPSEISGSGHRATRPRGTDPDGEGRSLIGGMTTMGGGRVKEMREGERQR